MSSYSENFRNTGGHSPCLLCLTDIDSQASSCVCPEIVVNVKIQGRYPDLFSDNITCELANTLINIDQYRQDNLNKRSIEM